MRHIWHSGIYKSKVLSSAEIRRNTKSGMCYIYINGSFAEWQGKGFTSIDSAEKFLKKNIAKSISASKISEDADYVGSIYTDLSDAMTLFGFDKWTSEPEDDMVVYNRQDGKVTFMIFFDMNTADISVSITDGKDTKTVLQTRDVDKVVTQLDTLFNKYEIDGFELEPIESSINAGRNSSVNKKQGKVKKKWEKLKDEDSAPNQNPDESNLSQLTRKLARTPKSSNVWAIGIDVKNYGDRTGTVYAQFKNKNGGPGDVYKYYDVPVEVYRRWCTTTSVGHYFWVNIRNNYAYSKLSGNKRGKLPNAIN